MSPDRFWRRLLLAAALAVSLAGVAHAQAQPKKKLPRGAAAGNWPCFRGPERGGVAEDKNVPLTWSDTENIVWKLPLPGAGVSSPIVWGDHIYLTAYTGYGLVKNDPNSNLHKLKRHLLCVDRKTGELLWQADRPIGRGVPDHPIVDFLDRHGYASCTPVAEESGVYVYYGTDGAVAYHHDGKQQWERRLGDGIHSWGSASSPVLVGDLLIIHADIEAQALVALDKRTGEEKWKVATGGNGDSWSTPLLVDVEGRQELICHHSVGEPATVLAVDPRTGRERWQARVLQNYLCPSPIVHDGIVYLLAYQKGAAIRAGGSGDVTDSHVEWTMNRGSEVGTPVFHDGHLYWTDTTEGIAYCVDARTGELVSSERLPEPGIIYASAVLANYRIYYVSREKGTFVVAADPEFELLAHNVIASDGSIFNATPAVSRGQLFLRSNKCLYCIGRK